ncbi:MAG: MGMT family protein [Pseudomonadales bacterium]
MGESQISSQDRVWQVVAGIPKGKVATYGQVAELCGMPAHSRLVGRILAQLPPGTKLPWHRVVASQGRVTNPNRAEQIKRLAAEGIAALNGRISLRQYRWRP